MSVFIGSQLTAVLDELEKKGNIKLEKGDNMYMKLGIDKIPTDHFGQIRTVTAHRRSLSQAISSNSAP